MFVGCRGFCVKVRFWVKKFTFPLILFKCIHFPLAFSIFHFHCHSLQFLLCCLFVLQRVLGERGEEGIESVAFIDISLDDFLILMQFLNHSFDAFLRFYGKKKKKLWRPKKWATFLPIIDR